MCGHAYVRSHVSRGMECLCSRHYQCTQFSVVLFKAIYPNYSSTFSQFVMAIFFVCYPFTCTTFINIIGLVFIGLNAFGVRMHLGCECIWGANAFGVRMHLEVYEVVFLSIDLIEP